MPIYNAAEATDEYDPLAISISCVVIFGMAAHLIYEELRGRVELRDWPRSTKAFRKGCTGPVIRNSEGAITSNHSPQLATTEDDAKNQEIINPVTESGDNSVDDEAEYPDSTAAELLPDLSPIDQLSTGGGLRVLVAAAKFKRVHKRNTNNISNTSVAITFKGVIMDETVPEKPYGLLQLLLGAVQSIGLPSLIISHLGERLGLSSDEWNAWFGGGSVVTALAVFAIIGPEYLCPINTVWTLISLSAWFGTVVVVIAFFIFKSTNDAEWIDIHDFLRHRSVRLNRHNAVALLGLVFVMFQLNALALRVLPNPLETEIDVDSSSSLDPYDRLNSYAQWKVDVKRWFEYTLLKFDTLFSFEVAFQVSAFAVAAWWIMFGGIMLRLVMHSNEKGGDGVACHHIQTRYLLYNQMASFSLTWTLFTVLSDSMLLVVVTNLISALDCTYDRVHTIGNSTIAVDVAWWSRNISYLDAKPEWECWSRNSPQLGYAVVSLVALLFYIPSAVVLSPFITSDSDGFFQPDSLDVRFSSRFLLTERSGKLLLSAVTIFFGQHYPVIVLLFQFIVYSLLFQHSKRNKPCSIIWVNYLRSAIFLTSALGSVAVLIDVTTHWEWWPVIFFFSAEVFVATRLAKQVIDVQTRKNEKKLAQVYCLPRIGKLDELLGDLSGGTFNDSASLRGTQHSMRALYITIANRNLPGDVNTNNFQTRIAGIACDYEMDGQVVRTPLHVTAYHHSPKWSMKMRPMFLMQGESICLFAIYFPTGSTRYAGAAAIRVWTESNGVLNPAPREFGRRPPPGKYEVYVPDVVSLGSGQVIAFHGSMGEGLQMLGAVVQHSTEYTRSKELVAALAQVCTQEIDEASKANATWSNSTRNIVNETAAIVRAEERQHWQLKWEQDALGKADEAMAVGTRIHVVRKGWGTYKGFKRNLVGANQHSIEFDKALSHEGKREETLSLKSEEWSVTKVEEELGPAETAQRG